jgi:hypothetical protein
MVDNPENVRAAEENVGTSERQEVIGAEKEKVNHVEKERRSKKRNERPSFSEEGEKTMPARATKRIKTVAPRPSKKAASTIQGKVSEPNTNSNSEAQNLPLPTSTIDFTKPIAMILPGPLTQTVHISSSSSSSDSSSSSSEGTLSDSSQEPIRTLLKKGLKPKPKQITKTHMTKEYASHGNSVLDHLDLTFLVMHSPHQL